MVLALVVVGASFAALVAQVVLKLAVPTAAPKGITTLIVVVLFLGGIQLLCLSIIGSYLAHMYEEVKARPAYIVDEVLNAPQERRAEGGELEGRAARPAEARSGPR